MTTTENSQIHVKSYFASTVPDAIEVARDELGADALFSQQPPRPAREALHLGAVEVVFGVYSEKRPVEPPPTASAASPATSMDDLRRKMDEIRGMLTRSAAPPSSRNRVRLVEQVLRSRCKGPAFWLNGKPIFLRGISMHEEAPFRRGTRLQPGGRLSWAG